MPALHRLAGRASPDRPAAMPSLRPGHGVAQPLSGLRRRRQPAGLPPDGRLAAPILAARPADQVDTPARARARAAPAADGFSVLGPAPAPLAILRGQHRRRFLLKCRRDVLPQPLIRSWLAAVKIP